MIADAENNQRADQEIFDNLGKLEELETNEYRHDKQDGDGSGAKSATRPTTNVRGHAR